MTIIIGAKVDDKNKKQNTADVKQIRIACYPINIIGDLFESSDHRIPSSILKEGTAAIETFKKEHSRHKEIDCFRAVLKNPPPAEILDSRGRFHGLRIRIVEGRPASFSSSNLNNIEYHPEGEELKSVLLLSSVPKSAEDHLQVVMDLARASRDGRSAGPAFSEEVHNLKKAVEEGKYNHLFTSDEENAESMSSAIDRATIYGVGLALRLSSYKKSLITLRALRERFNT